MSNKSVKKTKTKDGETTIDFGTRKIPRYNYSRIITLDKKLFENCGCSAEPDAEIKAQVHLVKKPDESYIKLIPFCENSKMDKGSKKDSGVKN